MVNATEIEIALHSCSLFGRHGSAVTFLGSALFFLHKGLVLAATADHAIGSFQGALQIAVKNQLYDVEILKRVPAYDLCLLRPLRHPDGICMRLSVRRNIPANVTLYAYEYSTTFTSGGAFYLNPATRIGNCVRLVQIARFGRAGVDMLELSFPALKGASGAPVVELRGSQIIAHGVIVANSEHHLLPTQIETVLSQDNSLLEERKYFLPQAVAVHSMHLARIVDGHFPHTG